MNKRTFIKTLGITAAGIAIAPTELLAKQPEIANPRIPIMIFKRQVEVGFNTLDELKEGNEFIFVQSFGQRALDLHVVWVVESTWKWKSESIGSTIRFQSKDALIHGTQNDMFSAYAGGTIGDEIWQKHKNGCESSYKRIYIHNKS